MYSNRDLLRHCSDVGESFSESHENPLSTATEGRGRAVKRRVAGTQDDHVAMELGEGLGTVGAHTCEGRGQIFNIHRFRVHGK